MRNESGNVKGNIPGKQKGGSKSVISRQNLIEEQSNDKQLLDLEAEKVSVGYLIKDNILMRKCSPTECDNGEKGSDNGEKGRTCQLGGKPNQNILKAPLCPIPAFDEHFSHINIDCVGPLPKTKSQNKYLLTIVCSSTQFPEAIPLRSIKTNTILKALIKFFTLSRFHQTLKCIVFR